MEFGLLLHTRQLVRSEDASKSFDQLWAAAAQAEDLGFDHIWLGDSVTVLDKARGDCLTTMAALAARTKKIRLGAVPMLAALRNPVLLAHALATRLGLLPERPELPNGSRWLVVAGSVHPATRRQIREARAAGLSVLATPERAAGDGAEAIARLIDQAIAALQRETWDLVVVTGGETAVALWTALGAERIDLVGAPAPGLAFGQLRVPGRDPLPLLTKAGGFGPPDLLVSLQRETVA